MVGVGVSVGVGVGVSVGVCVGVSVIVGVGVDVGVGVGVGNVYEITFEIIGPPDEQICVNLKYIVPDVIVSRKSKFLGDTQLPAEVVQVILSVEYSKIIVPHSAPEIKLYSQVVPET